ncbi:hypothetical protein Pmar_PMAR028665, partial [Perkinsus marinus ATCC 50983]
ALLFLRGANTAVLRFPSEAHAKVWAAAVEMVTAVPLLDELLSSKEARKKHLQIFKM